MKILNKTFFSIIFIILCINMMISPIGASCYMHQSAFNTEVWDIQTTGIVDYIEQNDTDDLAPSINLHVNDSTKTSSISYASNQTFDSSNSDYESGYTPPPSYFNFKNIQNNLKDGDVFTIEYGLANSNDSNIYAVIVEITATTTNFYSNVHKNGEKDDSSYKYSLTVDQNENFTIIIS